MAPLATFSKVARESLKISRPIPWLESRFHFSFAEYYDPARENFGVLRVLNDDIVKPKGGFPPHPHRNMEIISYVVSGGLSHQDNMGSEETLHRGSVQYMSAGTGVRHSEFNHSGKELLRFLQIWIVPDRSGLTPNYGSRVYKDEDRLNRWLHLVSGDSKRFPGTIPIHQDANLFVTELSPSEALTFDLKEGRQAYIVQIEGDSDVEGLAGGLKERDGLKAFGPGAITFKAGGQASSHVFLIEMAKE